MPFPLQILHEITSTTSCLILGYWKFIVYSTISQYMLGGKHISKTWYRRHFSLGTRGNRSDVESARIWYAPLSLNHLICAEHRNAAVHLGISGSAACEHQLSGLMSSIYHLKEFCLHNFQVKWTLPSLWRMLLWLVGVMEEKSASLELSWRAPSSGLLPATQIGRMSRPSPTC